MRRTGWIVALTVTIAMSGSVLGEEDMRDLADLRCRDVMLFSGSDRDITVMALHAFLMGKANTSKYSVQKLSKATDSFLEYCLDQPRKQAIGVLEQFVSEK